MDTENSRPTMITEIDNGKDSIKIVSYFKINFTLSAVKSLPCGLVSTILLLLLTRGFETSSDVWAGCEFLRRTFTVLTLLTSQMPCFQVLSSDPWRPWMKMTSARIGSGLGSYKTSHFTHFSGSDVSTFCCCCGRGCCSAPCNSLRGLNVITLNVRRMGSNLEDGESTDAATRRSINNSELEIDSLSPLHMRGSQMKTEHPLQSDNGICFIQK